MKPIVVRKLIFVQLILSNSDSLKIFSIPISVVRGSIFIAYNNKRHGELTIISANCQIEYFYRLHLFSRRAVKKKKRNNKEQSKRKNRFIIVILLDRFAKEAKSWRRKKGGGGEGKKSRRKVQINVQINTFQMERIAENDG